MKVKMLHPRFAEWFDWKYTKSSYIKIKAKRNPCERYSSNFSSRGNSYSLRICAMDLGGQGVINKILWCHNYTMDSLMIR
ncbi:hypothetical protein chiPu_0013392 [Chiloscyllium punctatum]|uniref:Uncharacterized protein n=1 Tax=Chiloscyllium punctatum TaxID=137246 RepID=A0A401SWZ2_CHIPU|nr:hypothetical protein [Chiloscyllium punctatum]